MIFETHVGSDDQGDRVPDRRSDEANICVPNINTRQRRMRLAAGAIQLVISLALLGVLVATGAQRWWRLALFPMFWGSAVGFFQWRDKT